MDLLNTLDISGSGLAAQRVRLQTAASNLANARTTRTPEGGPYRRRSPVFQAEAIDPFGSELDRALATVQIERIDVAEGGGQTLYDPTHPDADERGYVTMPDINILHEMADLMTTARSYEANANVIDITRDLANRALDIGR
ncbi:MAG: flagellar basal body rod protein FlgC [Deltaproteobacteria bacterium]|nr:flagellar basal body rod protein FlgC [Deltaproteobacteria bacterium]